MLVKQCPPSSCEAFLYIKDKTPTRSLVPTMNELIGKGGDGFVYPHRLDPNLVVKKIAIGEETNLNEHVIGMRLRHKTLVRTVGAFIKHYPSKSQEVSRIDKYKIVMERVRGKTILKKYQPDVSQTGSLGYLTRKEILAQAKECCRCLYRERVVWQDVHADNMFFTDQGELKIFDFGGWREELRLGPLAEKLLCGAFELISALASVSNEVGVKVDARKDEENMFGRGLLLWGQMKLGQIQAIDNDDEKEAFLYTIFDEAGNFKLAGERQ